MARGELRRGLPVGLVWGEADGEIVWHPDEAVTGVITAIFDRFAVCGSVRGVWLWLRDQGLKFPLQPAAYLHGTEIQLVPRFRCCRSQVFAGSPDARQHPFGPGHQDPYTGGYAAPSRGGCGVRCAFPLPFDIPAYAFRVILFPLRN
jgi:hypothetical protein